MKDEIVVSVLCTAYNHEKYIRKCLDGFIMQKTDFLFEVLIHDDASTDNTAQIIREYERNYPEMIKPVYQTENQYSKGVPVTKAFLVPKCRGKYIALCEGDDYWRDSLKLQKQVDAMERQSSCHMCVHRVSVVEEDGRPQNKSYPECNLAEGILSSEEFLKAEYFQTSSYLFRAEDYLQYITNYPEFRAVAPFGDRPYLLYFAQLGDNYYIADAMSCYRTNSMGSWTQRNIFAQKEKKVTVCRKALAMYEAYNAYTEGRFQRYCYARCLQEQINVARLLGEYGPLRQSRYKSGLRDLTLKNRLLFIGAFVPFLLDSYDFVKRHIKG